ncbi:SEL1-like repeat protein [Novosphingobium beihaiensis]|uniref:Lipoprotein n=1 Tax=Novosphingobium beihaiensis TaxID=2930389 RepID=A0ABT0BLE2_9SPHN|nr:SEL1-like repeat protein [Novosphingobium beihaiensis]MCJ2185641.1 hypothetical protein [Novosphingobium beihaiensis]
MRRSIAILMLLSSGCVSNSYMGIPLAPGKADAGVQELAKQARNGDKQAQFRLGLEFERGCFLPKNTHLAERLYQRSMHRDKMVEVPVYLPGTSGNAGSIYPMTVGRQNPSVSKSQMEFETIRSIAEASARCPNDQ